MDQLVANSAGCKEFAPNNFKREKCKNCGRLWNEHLGAIDEHIVQSFLEAKNKEAEEKSRVEAAVKELAREKARAKKKDQQAVEDEWFMDGGTDAKPDVESEEDEDMGFRMFDARQVDAVNQTVARQSITAQNSFKVRNLIDFGECNEQEETRPEEENDQAVAAPVPDVASTVNGGAANYADFGATHAAATSSSAGPALLQGVSSPNPDVQGLHSEVEYLRQMLATSAEEKLIQVGIIQDELDEARRANHELRKRNSELEARLQAGAHISNAGAMGREAATQEIRKIRQEAERHLEWIRNRVLQARVNQVDGLQGASACA